MTRKELERALELAKIGEREYNWTTLAVFDGFGLPDFEPIQTTLWAVSRIIRYQCLCFDGTLEAVALNELATFGRKRFLIIGEGVPAGVAA